MTEKKNSEPLMFYPLCQKEEVWIPVKGFEPLYEVSNYGRLRSLKHRWGFREKPQVLSIRLDGKGYVQYRLYDGEGSSKYIKAHKLVLEHFGEDPKLLPTINHKDENKQNNHLCNLEYMTNLENCEYSQAKMYTFTNPKGEIQTIFNMSRFCRENNLTASLMNKVLRGLRKTHKGWSRLQEDLLV